MLSTCWRCAWAKTATLDAFTSQLGTQSRVMQAWKVAGQPTTFLIDRQGRVVASAIGGRELDHPEMVEAIRGLLRK